MVRLIMMCGLPASGKTTLAKKISRRYDMEIISSDSIRKELYGDENVQQDNSKVFRLVQDRLVNYINKGQSVIMDATNLISRKRRGFINEIKKRTKISFSSIIIITSATLHECLVNNLNRERHVPEEVIGKMRKTFQMPCYQEGFSHILIHYYDKQDKGKNILQRVVHHDKQYSHDTQWHKFSIGKHEELAGNFIMDKHLNSNELSIRDKITLIEAAFIHDNGKPFTKTFANNKGEISTNAHYYGHESIGALNSLAITTNGDMFTIIDRAILISYHMLLHHYLRDKALNLSLIKLQDRVGGRYSQLLYELYKADCYAH